jgi:hypothetical protein
MQIAQQGFLKSAHAPFFHLVENVLCAHVMSLSLHARP